MTVEIIKYAQSITKKPMKGMLTGPVTMLQWSFVRDDQPRKDTTFQLALAIREEVHDLEAAGISVIQVHSIVCPYEYSNHNNNYIHYCLLRLMSLPFVKDYLSVMKTGMNI